MRVNPPSFVFSPSDIILQISSSESAPVNQSSTYRLSLSSLTVLHSSNLARWFITVALSKKGLAAFPKVSLVNLIVLIWSFTFHKNRWTSLSSVWSPIIRKAFWMSADNPYCHLQNRSKILTRSGIIFGPFSMQSFRLILFTPLHEASKTGLTLVDRLLSLTTGW